MRNDCVLSYHIDPATCGVAKFNLALASRLGVPCVRLMTHEAFAACYPLVSIKPEEMPPGVVLASRVPYDLFLHGPSDGPPLLNAKRVFAANREIADRVRELRPDVIAAWCPSTLEGNAQRGPYRVLTFGMAHKLALSHYRQLKHRLDSEGRDYTIEWSVAHHHGTDKAPDQTQAMRDIFGDRLRVLGALADDALAKELHDCDAVAVYFDPALRENNTTIWAAIGANKVVYTNTDTYSPSLDPSRYSWNGLVALVCGN